MIHAVERTTVNLGMDANQYEVNFATLTISASPFEIAPQHGLENRFVGSRGLDVTDRLQIGDAQIQYVRVQARTIGRSVSRIRPHLNLPNIAFVRCHS